jgi:predicted RNase H-like nuclease (RuvC/YqgF family)
MSAFASSVREMLSIGSRVDEHTASLATAKTAAEEDATVAEAAIRQKQAEAKALRQELQESREEQERLRGELAVAQETSRKRKPMPMLPPLLAHETIGERTNERAACVCVCLCVCLSVWLDALQ